MGKITGFLEFRRAKQHYRPVAERVRDWKQVMLPFPEAELKQQGARCMDCGVPFCHQGCPLGNIIPDWNDFVYRGLWEDASARLHATNNFPEFTGTLCPAPCEGACVLGINDDPVTIKAIELAIAEQAWARGRLKPEPPTTETGKKVAVVGSGPAGLAVAQQLRRAGHKVTVFERDDRIGGLMRYGIPEFKMEKKLLDRRVAQLRAEGAAFKTNAHVGVNVPVDGLKRDFDAIVLAGGAGQPRDLPVPGRELKGIHFALEYLVQANRRCEDDAIPATAEITARGKHAIVIGGGDTGADCLGTALRQGAASVHQLEIMPRPPETRASDNPWPQYPMIYRVSSAHAEGGERLYAVSTKRFVGDGAGRVQALELTQVEMVRQVGRTMFNEIPDSTFTLPAELVLLAMGFVGPVKAGMLEQLGVKFTDRGNVWRDANWMTSVPGVFTAGDMQHGQSLIVWAIAEGRSAARGVDKFLMGASDLPAPL
ncbi:MAG: glutamate synthase [Candidatus Muproteobacteria bacterium RIFCSPHIGHO2_02_FULL_65_16]|uniref:Glutamate synthase n=1 Tax=Candidatus Muproteobacteria bacterium RIFCSPHIGHO2_02_FULL_65_16 TaxID=1817766 RepID=A0A1F6TWZ1_9PROT|nr:MAG: glutamate synthase [Candidatus Muproteobacteria bacterium RIFCSPHIGHO2_02_FULL_65_16]